MYYTGVGSRETPAEICGIMEDASYRLARVGIVLRSGKATGADSSFQKGVERYVIDSGCQNWASLAEVYIPNKYFGERSLKDYWDMDLDTIDYMFEQEKLSHEILSTVHNADYLRDERQSAYRLHRRNIHQVLGPNLEMPSPSKFCIYYCPETRTGNPKGGTATAVKLAKQYGTRTLNLLHEENHATLEKFIQSLEVKRGIRSEISQ